MTPFRNEKNSNWEGAYRVPAMVRWPGKIKADSVSNEIVAHLDWLPTILAVAGDTQVTDKLLKGYTVGNMTYKVHLDGYNLVPYLTGQVAKSPRNSFMYINDDQQLTGLRYDNFKFVFMEQRVQGTCPSGPSRSSRCGFRRSSISAPIRTSARTSRPTPTTTGSWITPSRSFPPRTSSASSS